ETAQNGAPVDHLDYVLSLRLSQFWNKLKGTLGSFFNGHAYFVLYCNYGIYPVPHTPLLLPPATIRRISADPLNPHRFGHRYPSFSPCRGLRPRGRQLAERERRYFQNGARFGWPHPD